MVNDQYILKHSRLSIVFQFGFIGIISIILYFAIGILVWFFATILLFVLLYIFRKKPEVKYLCQLEHAEWSIQFIRQAQVHRVYLTHLTDHYFYIVVYFSDQKIKNIVIWKDQMDSKAWKWLKIRAKLN